MLLAMQKVQMIGLISDREKAVSLLLRLGLWHPEDASQIERQSADILEKKNGFEREEVAFQLARTDAALQLLPKTIHEKIPDKLPSLAAVRDMLDKLMPMLQDLAGRLDETKEKISMQPSRAAFLQKLWPATSRLMLAKEEAALAITYDRRREDKIRLTILDAELKLGPLRQATTPLDDTTLATCIACRRESFEAVKARLRRDDLSLMEVPREFVGTSVQDARRHLEFEQKDLERRLSEIKSLLEEISQRDRGQVLASRVVTRRRLEELDASRLMGATEHTFVMEGWVPKKDFSKLVHAFQAEFGDSFVLHECGVSSHESNEAPVAFDNPPYLKPYQDMIRLMGMPESGSRDPSFLMAVFLPLFFGIIVGDIGYGMIMLLLGLWARKRFAKDEHLRGVAGVFVFGSVWAIFWGLLYGEIFGTLQYQLGLENLYLFLPRTGERIGELMIFAVVLGAAHVTLGLAFGLWDAFREKHLKEALAKGGLLITLCGLFVLTAIIAGLLPGALYTPTYVAMIIGAVILISGAGILGAIELFETMGNILSYLRLTAVGLAGVYIALVANKMVGVLGNVVLGIVVALLLHALNFAILLMSPSIQALRLHYVEFFRQFYRSGGREYQPLRYGT